MDFYTLCKKVTGGLSHVMFRLRKTGVENIPAQGPVILAVNHKSGLDPVAVGITCPRQIRFMAKAELFNNKLFGKLISSLGAFPVHRNKGDIGAIKAAFSIFKDNGVMLIFPEGGRITKKEPKLRAKPGVVMMAQRAQVPVIPVLIDGKYRWMGKITVRYGKPVTYEEYKGQKLSGEKMQELADELLEKIYGQAEVKKLPGGKA
ncbi:MAG: lysophospholipid acyltransferase family protein [Candidatus Ornithomonoglobus sp.]